MRACLKELGVAMALASGVGLAACGGSQSGGTTTPAAVATVVTPVSQSGCTVFPSDAIFNTRIDSLPVHASSATWVASVGASTRFHPDWGNVSDPDQADAYGIPVNVLGGTSSDTTWSLLSQIAWPDEADCAVADASATHGHRVQRDCSGTAQPRFPFSSTKVLIEGGSASTNTGDRHVLVIEQTACRLWETGNAYVQANGSWQVGAVAEWDLSSNSMRTAGWTSADAAGLPILPLLARAEEAVSGEIKHAMRVTFQNGLMAPSYVWPATHQAGSGPSNGIPFGALLRLKSSFVIPSTWSTQAKAVATAMQRYGLYVADNGSNLYVQGDPNDQWGAAVFDELKTITMNSFEFVDTSGIASRTGFSATSYRVPSP